MHITFLGAASVVTGSKFLLEFDGKKVLVDCGLFQGVKDLRVKNWKPLAVEASEVDAILLTHAHIDHSGYIPRLVKDGFKGPVYCTRGTLDLVKILLPDSAHLMREDADYANRKHYSSHNPALPLFETRDVEEALKLFKVINYGEEFKLFDHVFVKFINAGHILGASSVVLDHKKEGVRIGFSGDLGRFDDPIMKKPEFFDRLNYLVMESTYGDRRHSSNDPLDDLSSVINEAFERGGSVLIPAFAVGRTQSLLFYLAKLLQSKRIPSVPIFLDSPMACNASDIYCRHADEHHLSHKQCINICAAAHFVKGAQESRSINYKPSPMIVLSASGMATGGRVLHHLKRFLPDEKNTILFTGYQSPETRGHQLVNGASHVTIHGEDWPVRAKVVNIESMSAHADSEELMRWLKESKIGPKKVFVVHGEKEPSETLAKRIKKELTFESVVPKIGERFQL